jgi:O-antigen/teichoic acid export membrane protein
LTSISPALVLKPRALLLRLKSDPILRNSAIYLTGSTLAGLLGYVFHFETGHLLGPSAYSIVASGIASLYVLTLPVVGLQLVSARFASIAAAHNEPQAVLPMLGRLTGVSLLGALPVIVVLAIFAPSVASFLNLNDRRVVYLMLGVALATLLVTVNRGALQGLRRFVVLSGNMLVDMVSRLAFAAALVATGLGALGALAALAIGPMVAYGQSFFFLRSDRKDAAEPTRLSGIGAYAILATIASIGINYLFSVDTLLAKHYLAANAAGLYAAGSVLGRVVYFLGLSVTGVMFPEVANLHARDQRHFHVVDVSLLLVVVMGAGLIAVYSVIPGVILLPYGSSFGPARQYLGLFAVALTMLAIANLFINYFLSIARKSFVVPLFGTCILETVLLTIFHADIWQILFVVVCSLGLLAVMMVGLYASDRFAARRSET